MLKISNPGDLSATPYAFCSVVAGFVWEPVFFIFVCPAFGHYSFLRNGGGMMMSRIS